MQDPGGFKEQKLGMAIHFFRTPTSRPTFYSYSQTHTCTCTSIPPSSISCSLTPPPFSLTFISFMQTNPKLSSNWELRNVLGEIHRPKAHREGSRRGTQVHTRAHTHRTTLNSQSHVLPHQYLSSTICGN